MKYRKGAGEAEVKNDFPIDDYCTIRTPMVITRWIYVYVQRKYIFRI